MGEPCVVALPRPWRALFAVELPLVACTVLFWVAAPGAYLRGVLGMATPGPADVFLLRLYAGTVGSLAFGFYAWLLAQRSVHLATFRAFQVCLGIGDAAIVTASAAAWSASSGRSLLAAQIAMAAGWLVVRVRFLRRRSRPAQGAGFSPEVTANHVSMP